jgi:hypothetical protein
MESRTDKRKRLLHKDQVLNKTALDLLVFSGIGYGVGVALSVFCRNKLLARYFTAGVGSSYAFCINKDSFNKLI